MKNFKLGLRETNVIYDVAADTVEIKKTGFIEFYIKGEEVPVFIVSSSQVIFIQAKDIEKEKGS